MLHHALSADLVEDAVAARTAANLVLGLDRVLGAAAWWGEEGEEGEAGGEFSSGFALPRPVSKKRRFVPPHK